MLPCLLGAIALMACAAEAGAASAAIFPLSISASGHYLQTPVGSPFLVREASSWGLIQIVSLSHAKDYVDKRRAQGFNAFKVSIISNDSNFVGDYREQTPKWNGVAPFTTPGNFGTPNPAYFDHAVDVVNYLLSNGMLVFLFPNYFGFSSDGWRQQMLADTDAHCFAYGQYLGNRFKSFPNVIWAAGGDHYPDATEESRQGFVIDGIRSVSPTQLWTAHWDNGNALGGQLSTEVTTLAARMGTVVNGL